MLHESGLRVLLIAVCLLSVVHLKAAEPAGGEAENASNPLAKTRNTDFYGTGFRVTGAGRRRHRTPE